MEVVITTIAIKLVVTVPSKEIVVTGKADYFVVEMSAP
jgi:hypothetical protein